MKNILKHYRISQELKKRLKQDKSFLDDTILGSQCSYPVRYAAKIFTPFLEKNIGDPGLCSDTLSMEQDYIRNIGRVLGTPTAAGTAVTGGTEANLIALWAARNHHRGKRHQVILSETAHFSFDKGASMMGLELIKILIDKHQRIQTEIMHQHISSAAMMLVGVTGTTGAGAVDDIETLSFLAAEHGLYLNVDAAFGGYVLPFLKEAGFPSYVFDFSLPGVSSISIAPHTMGRAPIPAGEILFRDDATSSLVPTDVGYLSGGLTSHKTLAGIRSGASVAAVWALWAMMYLDGYVQKVADCMKLTWWFYHEIEKRPFLNCIIPPEINIAAIISKKFSIEELATKLRERNWAVSLFPGFIRIAAMHHVKKALLKFLEDLDWLHKE